MFIKEVLKVINSNRIDENISEDEEDSQNKYIKKIFKNGIIYYYLKNNFIK